MTHYTTLIQRCRATNSLLADEIDAEFRRMERVNETLRDLLQKAKQPKPRTEPRKRYGHGAP